MSPQRCVPDEALVGASAWPANDPRRAHVAACARCHAVVLAHALLSDEAAEPGPLPEDVRATLDAAIERGLNLAASAAAGATTGPRAHGPVVAIPNRRGITRWLALAAAFVAVAGAATLWRLRPGGPALERGEPGPVAVQVFEPRTAGGRLEFRWRASPGADAYRLELLRPDFAVVHRRSVGADTTAELRVLEETPALAGSLLYWRVVADSAGARLSASEPRAIRLP